MNIPDYNTCCELLERFEVPEHIIDHSRQVAVISLCLREGLLVQGIGLGRDLLLSAGLLHDIAKMASLENGRDHAELGGEWLDREGFPEIAEIVRNHVRLVTDLAGPIVAKEIIYYADKRVRHVEIVSVAERLVDLRKRYGGNSPSLTRLAELENLTLAVEKKIFSGLNFFPEEVSRLCYGKNLLT
ncbi:MAG: HDIG domain-containing protein [Deltaproteobacteria bacterium]|nr:HDIG domain-containing protein [Deltaproteobacteria bacterium]